jgi:cytosine deaminase
MGARALSHIARAVLRRRFDRRVLCGHCCSLAIQPPDVVAETLDLVVEAGLAVVSLPLCNLYLQDRVPGRTPRWRGVTLLHELRARGIRSPWPRQLPGRLSRIRRPRHARGFPRGHAHRPPRPAVRRVAQRSITTTPADLMGLADAGRIGPGQPADLVLRTRLQRAAVASPGRSRGAPGWSTHRSRAARLSRPDDY